MTETPGKPHPGDELLRVAETVHAGEVSVAFSGGPTVMAKLGDKLLDIAEASHVRIGPDSRSRGPGQPLSDALGRAANARAARPRPRLPHGLRLARAGARGR